jgi:hypothetical protein
MSWCQITFVFGEQSAQIAAVLFDKAAKDPFAELQRVAAKNLDLGAGLDLARVFFQYEDDDGDYVTVADNADALEAFNVHEDAAQEDILLIVRLRPAPEISPAGAKVTADDDLLSDGENKEEDDAPASNGLSSLLDENFVIEFCAFLSDPVVRQVLPEVSANIAAAVLKRASGKDLYEIAAANAVLKQKPFLTKDWPFMNQWISAYDQWILGLTEDQLGKVAFQIPIVLARLVAKREKLYKAIFVKRKSHKKILKITQFDFGSVDFSSLLEQVLKNPVDQVGHAGRVCSICKNAIDGVRYQCMVCVGFDMCETCESSGSHPSDHAMMKFRSSVSGFVGLAHASAVYGKKALKYQLKAMKQEAKLAKKEMRLARKGSKDHDHKHGKYGKHGKHAMPPAYVPSLAYAAVAAGERKPVKGFYGPVTENADGKTRQ